MLVVDAWPGNPYAHDDLQDRSSGRLMWLAVLTFVVSFSSGMTGPVFPFMHRPWVLLMSRSEWCRQQVL